MSIFEPPELKKLETQSIWKETSEIVEYIYTKLNDFPDEEKWTSAFKLRTGSNDLLFTMAMALGDSSPGATETMWSQVRKHAVSLKALYRFTCRQKFIDIEPEIMVKLDKLLGQIDEQVTAAYKRTKAANLEEMEFWHKKYKMWKDMHHES